MRSILTVLDEASNHNLTTLAVVKQVLGITDTSEDANLALWLAQVSKEIEGYCNRVFVQETVKEVFRLAFPSSLCRDTLILRRPPIASITSVIENTTTLDPADYEFDPEAGLLMRLSSDCLSSWRWGKITVTYVGGFEVIPADLVRACLAWIRDTRFGAASDPNVKVDAVTNVGSLEYFNQGSGAQADASISAMPSEVRLTLNRYRLHSL